MGEDTGADTEGLFGGAMGGICYALSPKMCFSFKMAYFGYF